MFNIILKQTTLLREFETKVHEVWFRGNFGNTEGINII